MDLQLYKIAERGGVEQRIDGNGKAIFMDSICLYDEIILFAIVYLASSNRKIAVRNC